MNRNKAIATSNCKFEVQKIVKVMILVVVDAMREAAGAIWHLQYGQDAFTVICMGVW